MSATTRVSEATHQMSAPIRLSEATDRIRVGCKGPAAEAWLASHGITVPQGANQFAVDTRGLLSARLATSEFLFEALEPEAVRALASLKSALERAEMPSGVYPVLRQDCVFELEGPGTDELLLQTCAVDLKPVARESSASAGPVVLTSMIGVAVVLACRPAAHGPRFTVWSDPSYRHYFLHQLMAIVTDLGGAAHPASPMSSGGIAP